MKKKIAVILFLFFICADLFAQNDKNYNALLWRISGNGLSKPSYVFGTMHLTDKRLFHFTDSLYKSLEQCEGFAAELDMNSILSSFMKDFFENEAEKNEDDEKLLIDLLPESVLEKNRVKLEKKFDKPLANIRVKDIERAESRLKNELIAKGEMSTIMDAWLFDVAKRQGKWVGGIEDPEDQFGIEKTNSLEDKIETVVNDEQTNIFLEWMIKTYINQRLDSIDLSSDLWQGDKDVILVKRNHKMARRMDSMAHIRSTFFAVGAAHIPADEGVINLLRQKGFSVQPVFSRTTVAPENYTLRQIELQWHNVVTKDSLYALRMPGKPDDFSRFRGTALDMKLYFDLAKMLAYFSVSVPIPNAKNENRDSLLDQMADYYKKDGANLVTKKIVVNDHHGREISGEQDGAVIRMQFFIESSHLVMNLLSAYKNEVLFGNEPDRFFQSFKMNPHAEALANKKTEDWKRYDFGEYHFSVELPAEYKIMDAKTDESWETKFFGSQDIGGNIFMGILPSFVKQGYYSSSDSLLFEQMVGNMLQNMSGEVISRKHFTKNGYPAILVEGKGLVENQKIYAQVLIIHRGPWRYTLFTTSGEDNPAHASAAHFFDSFRFLSEPDSHWARVNAADKSFSIWSPSIIDSSEKSKTMTRYFVFDTITKTQIFIDKQVFPSYLWAASDTSLLNDKIRDFIGENDSVIYNRSFKKGKMVVGDLLIKQSGTHNYQRVRGVLNADTFYSVYSYLPLQYLEMDIYKKIFEEFKINNESISTSLYQRKPAELLVAMQSMDSTEFADAIAAFEYVGFLQEDIPLLQKALSYTYYDFHGNYNYGTNKSILDLVLNLDSTHTSISFVKENYEKLTGEKEVMKPYLLGLLSRIKTQKSYDVLKQLLLRSTPAITNAYYFPSGLYDSLLLTKTLYPEILSLSADPGLYDFVNDLTIQMIDSNMITLSTLKEYKNYYIKTAERELKISPTVQNENYYRYISLVKLLGKINTPQTNELLKKFGAIKANPLKLEVILALSANNQPPNPKDIALLAKDDQYRNDLYTGLKKIKKSNVFPQEFLSQKLLGQSIVFEYANEDDYSPDKIEYVGERIELFQGKRQKFYLYKVCFDNEEENETCYLGIAGPYSLDIKNYSSDHSVTEVYWEEEFNNKKIGEWLKEIIKQTEEWLKNKEK